MLNDKESSVAGTDNRAPMLEENDYKSWKIHMKRYIRSKPQGKAIRKSIVEGPAPHPMTTAVTDVANVVVKALRPKRDEEFTAEENDRDLADIQVASILSQGLPRYIFNTLNQTESAKEMWENIKLLMKGSGLSEQCKKEELFDEYERFRAIGNKSIHEYFILCHTVKQNQDISTKSYVELNTYLKAYEPHALKTLKKQEQSSSSVDPLAYLSHSSKHQTSTTVASPTSTLSSTLAPEQQAQSGSTKGNQGYGKKTDKNGKKVICYNCRGKGHVARECKEPKREKDTQYYKDKMMMSDAKDRGVILDAKAEAFLADVECTEPYDESLALTTIIAFQVSHEDAYDSDVDDGPHVVAAFMANLSSTEEASGTSSSKINEYCNIARESHPDIYDGNRLLDPTHVPSSVWETEERTALGAKSRAKMFEKPGTVKPINYDVLNNLYIKFVP
nr:hypothetical protein [Tanacetum cinerariifolium]